MKKVLVILATLISTTVMAENCRVSLTDIRGFVLGSFSGYGYTQREACDDGLRSCRYEKQRNIHDRRYRDASCNIDRVTRPTPPRDRDQDSCSFDLKRNNGRVIDTFTARGPNSRHACNRARIQCQSELDFRHSQGRNPRAYCEESNRRDRNDRAVYVTKSCSVDRVGPRGRTLQSHQATATGRQGTNVKAQACSIARQECSEATRYNRYQSCVERAYVDAGHDAGRRYN